MELEHLQFWLACSFKLGPWSMRDNTGSELNQNLSFSCAVSKQHAAAYLRGTGGHASQTRSEINLR